MTVAQTLREFQIFGNLMPGAIVEVSGLVPILRYVLVDTALLSLIIHVGLDSVEILAVLIQSFEKSVLVFGRPQFMNTSRNSVSLGGLVNLIFFWFRFWWSR